MKQLVIVGSGALAAEITSFIEDENYTTDPELEIKGYIDFDYNKDRYWKHYDYSKPILGDIYSYNPAEDDYFTVCIGDLKFRMEMINILRQKQANFINIIHPKAVIYKKSIIGLGNIIYPHCSIYPKAKISDFNIMTEFAIIGHDCNVGSNNFIGGDGLMGHAALGDSNFLGVRSVVLPNVKVGSNNIIQAGMIVDKSVKDNTTVFYRYKEQVLAIPKVQ